MGLCNACNLWDVPKSICHMKKRKQYPFFCWFFNILAPRVSDLHTHKAIMSKLFKFTGAKTKNVQIYRFGISNLEFHRFRSEALCTPNKETCL